MNDKPITDQIRHINHFVTLILVGLGLCFFYVARQAYRIEMLEKTLQPPSSSILPHSSSSEGAEQP